MARHSVEFYILFMQKGRTPHGVCAGMYAFSQTEGRLGGSYASSTPH